FMAITEEAIDGFARWGLSFAFEPVGEEMNTHVILDNIPQTLSLIVAEVESKRPLNHHIRTFEVVVKKADASIFIDGFSIRLADVMVKRGEEKQGTMGAFLVECTGNMIRDLFAISSKPQTQQAGEHVTGLFG